MIYTAIDLGSSGIKLLTGSYERGAYKIVSSHQLKSSGIRRGIILNIPSTARELKILKAEAEQTSGEGTRQVICNINGQHVNSYDVGSEGRALLEDFPGVVVQSAVISNIRRCMDQAGFSVQHFVPNAVASYYAGLSEEEDSGVVLAVDAGVQTISIAVFVRGHCRDTKVYPAFMEEQALVNETLTFLDDGGYAIDRIVLTGGASIGDVVFRSVAVAVDAEYKIGYPQGLKVDWNESELLAYAVALGMIRWVHKSSDS